MVSQPIRLNLVDWFVFCLGRLPRLPGSALKVHYQVKLQLQLRLSWAVTITLAWEPSCGIYFLIHLFIAQWSSSLNLAIISL